MSDNIDAHVTARYHIQKRLGKGAYGIVWRAEDKHTRKTVALKKIFDAFKNSTDAQRTFREVMFLQEFGDHVNVIRLLEIMRANNDIDLYLVFEHMDTDLHSVIKAKLLKDAHQRYIVYQLMKAMKYIHSGGVIHRDLKPSNVLLNADCTVKLCDFGLARSVLCLDEEAGNPELTDYVATRWYRAPEILLGSKSYTKGVDMWSLGCILAELTTGKAIFPGMSTLDQVDLILTTLPPPTKEDIRDIQAKYSVNVHDRRTRKRRTIGEALLSAPVDTLDLARKLLCLSPRKRLTASESLEHPYVAKFRDPADEPSLAYDVVPALDDDIMLSARDYRISLYKCIREKNKRICTERRPHASVDDALSDDLSISESSSGDSPAHATTPPSLTESPTSCSAASTVSDSSEDVSARHPVASIGAVSRLPPKPPRAGTSRPRPSSATHLRHGRPQQNVSTAIAETRAGSATHTQTQPDRLLAGRHKMQAMSPTLSKQPQNTSTFQMGRPPPHHGVSRLKSSSHTDLLKSQSAPDIMDSATSSNHPHKPPIMTGGTNITYHAWGSAPDKKQNCSPGSGRKFRPNGHQTISHDTGAILPNMVDRRQPVARISRPITAAYDASQTAITRTSSHLQPPPVGATSFGPVSSRVVPGQRPPSTIDVARRSAALRAATIVNQATLPTRRAFGSGGGNYGPPGPRRPLGTYTHTHATITRSNLQAIQQLRY